MDSIQQMWDDALVKASRAHSAVESSEAAGEVQFSTRGDTEEEIYDYSKSFAEQVDDWMRGIIPHNDTLLVSETPEVFVNVGFSKLPMTINQTHVDYALNGTKDYDHEIGSSLLKQLPDAIKQPIAILTSSSKEGTSVVAYLNLRHNGKQVIAPIVVNGYGRQNNLRIDSNAVTSIYGKNYSISRVLRDALENETNGIFSMYYVDINKATELLQGARVPMPKMPVTHNGGYIHTISDAGSPVKSQNIPQTETLLDCRAYQ